MATRWHYYWEGKRVGPVTWVALRRRAASGLLKRSDPVWGEGTADWVEAEEVEGLFPERFKVAKNVLISAAIAFAVILSFRVVGYLLSLRPQTVTIATGSP